MCTLQGWFWEIRPW